MRRRDFITGLALAVTMRSAEGQQTPKVYRIAIAHASALATDLTEGSRGSIATPAILKALRRSGYIEGQNLLIERYSGERRASHDPDLARDVVRRNPDLIIAIGNKLVLDLKAATSTIPIVGVFGQPVEEGIVGSLARPGGNITGVSDSIGWEQWGKRVQLLKQMVPLATRLGIVELPEARDESNAAQLELFGLTRVGPPLKRPIDETDYRRLFAALAQEGAEAILVTDASENTTNLRLVIELAEKRRLPLVTFAALTSRSKERAIRLTGKSRSIFSNDIL